MSKKELLEEVKELGLELDEQLTNSQIIEAIEEKKAEIEAAKAVEVKKEAQVVNSIKLCEKLQKEGWEVTEVKVVEEVKQYTLIK